MQHDEMSGGSSDSAESTAFWIEWFQSLKGNEFYCEVDEDYVLDRFNLTGLNTEVSHYSLAYDLITDQNDDDMDDQTRAEVETSARHLYGLIHARFIITARGLSKMLEKLRNADFGRCPRVNCDNQAVLPLGLADVPHTKCVSLWCPRCEDVYTPVSRRHSAIDGAHFGTTFPHLFMMAYPNMMPTKTAKRYVPRIFGFRIHEASKEERQQDALREATPGAPRSLSQEPPQ
ncbi:casein kinase 2 regulatory subunit [Geranomyces variabilis]|uniref:Casein kinase II subunit beta n=1 Tax=Geranomyces variabilis TaxID=109894 RepID=A0AAD5TPJ2_9FUNG|nr:casein kinase 2 regulatory subunit [Geranomyces variabilis]